MLNAEQVKPLISHADRYVRELAAEHFTRARLADPEVPLLMLAAAEEHRHPGCSATSSSSRSTRMLSARSSTARRRTARASTT
ncbi:MAG: hypothetical protein ACYTKD_05130 [Planctomycetota bacterium]